MPTASLRPIRRIRFAALVPAAVLLLVACGANGESRPDPRRVLRTTTSTTTTTTSTTTSTTTTTLPPVVVPGPQKLGAKCTVLNGRSTDAAGVALYCSPRKTAESKPFAGDVMRWEP